MLDFPDVHGHPGAREYCNQTTPHYVPNRSAMPEVIAAISHRAVFDDWDGACVDRGTLKQVIEKEQKEHSEGRYVKGLDNEMPFIGMLFGRCRTQDTTKYTWPTMTQTSATDK